MDRLRLLLLTWLLGVGVTAHGAALAEYLAGSPSLTGGIVSVVCDGDAGAELVLPLARALPDTFTVHALVESAARDSLAAAVVDAGLASRVAVSALAVGDRLPYASDLLNVVVVASETADEALAGEAVRVLAPLGRGFVRKTGTPRVEALCGAGVVDVRALPEASGWLSFRKPWPAEIGEWGHHLAGPGNNPVTPDLRVGPPRRLQWTAGPRWSRNHESAGSWPAMVSAGGRVFAVIDEGPIGISTENLPDKWVLIARDAFNGRVLWRRPVGDWGWRSWRKDWITRSVPPAMARGLVATREHVVVTDGFRGTVQILNAASGELLRRCPDTAGTAELVVSGGVVVTVRQATGEPPQVRALRLADGHTLWTQPAQCQTQTLCVLDSRVFWWQGEAVVAHDRMSGKRLWRSGKLPRSRWGQYCNLLAVEGTVLAASHGYPGTLVAFDAVSGKQLWQTRCRGGYVFSPPDVFVIDGTVWADGFFEEWLPARDRQQIAAGKKTRASIPAICRWPTFMRLAGRGLRNGELLREIDTGGMFRTGHHHRCYRCRATPRFVMAGRRGTEFVDLQGEDFSVDNWVRGSCQMGFMPANGLLYATPHPCSCYLAAKITGFNALTTRTEDGKRKTEDGRRETENGKRKTEDGRRETENGKRKTEEGTPNAERRTPNAERRTLNAEGGVRTGDVGVGTRGPGDEAGGPVFEQADWPMYRADVARSGSRSVAVPAALAPAWTADIGGRLTQPVVVGGVVLVAQTDAGVLHALSRVSGKRLWRSKAGGRIDSAPTVFSGHALFGCHDGWVYCLRLGDGAPVWRRRVAPQDRLIGDHGQLASAWPVHGAVLVSDGVAYAVAGRASVLDGGIHVVALDAVTGAIHHRTVLANRFEDPRKVEENNAGFMTGFLPDVLLRTGDAVYMRHAKFDLALNQQAQDGRALLAARVKHWGDAWAVSSTPGDEPHLVAGGGLLDDTMFSRMSWVRGNAAGQLIVWDNTVTCTVNMFHMPERKLLSPVFFPGTTGILLCGRKTFSGQSCPAETPLEPAAAACLWQRRVPIRVEAMVLAGATLILAGQPDRIDAADPLGVFEGRKGGVLLAVEARTGEILHELSLASPPVFDGLAAARGRLWMSTRQGQLVSFRPQEGP